MRKMLRFAVRVLVIVALVSLLSPLFSPGGPDRTPYNSALSNLQVVSIVEASCNGSVCNRRGTACNPATRAICHIGPAGCVNVKC